MFKKIVIAKSMVDLADLGIVVDPGSLTPSNKLGLMFGTSVQILHH